MRNALAAALQAFGRISVLVNNAGIAAPAGKPVHEQTEAEWQLMMDVDIPGTWRCSRLVLPHMIPARQGCIINIASVAGLAGFRFYPSYVAAKHAVIGLTKATAIDYAPYGIRVNAICPGMVRDDENMDGRMLRAVADALTVPLDMHEKLFMQTHLLRALVEPRDVALACTWLASDAGARITGSTVLVDAGFMAR